MLAVELAITLKNPDGTVRPLRPLLAVAFLLVGLLFIYRSFYGMRIVETKKEVLVEEKVPVGAAK